MPDWAYWLIAAVIFAIGELIVFTGFILGPLAVAALFAAVAAALGAGVEVQLAVFAVLGIGSMVVLRPIARRHMKTPPELRTNAEALIGKHARVLQAMTQDSPGLVRLENENWTARPAEGFARIDANTHVRVARIAGATAIVEPLEQAEIVEPTSQGA